MGNIYDPKALITLPGRSKFQLNYRNTFTAKMAQLIPALCKPVVPGDRFRISAAYQMQLAPLYNPVYDSLCVNFEAFFIPNRILDRKWKEFWTGYNEFDQMTPTEISPLSLTISVLDSELIPINNEDRLGSGLGISSLADYLGVQFAAHDVQGLPFVDSVQNIQITVNALPFLAYNRVYDDWYRNERTQKASLFEYYNPTYSDMDRRDYLSTVYSSNGGFEHRANVIPVAFHLRNYARDRYTTALPEPVIGGDVRIPANNDTGLTEISEIMPGVAVDEQGFVQNTDGLPISLSALALGTIQQLKFAFKEYEYRMKDTYNGNRYVESIESHYGIRVPDSTIQRSIYLGSSRDYVNFGEVYQTSSGDGTSADGALGDYAGRGMANGDHYLFDETFYEHGWILINFSVSPKARYFQGVQRYMTRYGRDDYFSPEFQNIGDDFITNNEIFNFANDLDGENEHVFGYQSRWYDLKSYTDELHGDFSKFIMTPSGLQDSQMTTWTFARAFESRPNISSLFSEIPVINRPFISREESYDNYMVDIAFSIDALRPVLTTETF